MTTFNTRIKHKRDTEDNWETYDPILLNGEKIIVDTSSGQIRTKTGDGSKTYTQLPFDDADIYTSLGNKANASYANIFDITNLFN